MALSPPTPASRFFDGTEAETLLRTLGARLAARGLEAEMHVVGGTAMAMLYSMTRRTEDVDALFQPRDEVLREAESMASEFELADDWLNDKVAAVMPSVADDAPRTVSIGPGIRVSVSSPEALLAMKVMTSRQSDGDREDAVSLIRYLGITDAEEVATHVKRYFPDSGLLDMKFDFFESVVAESLSTHSVTPLPVPTRPYERASSCGHWMPLAHRHCSLPRSHRGRQHR